jgi:hypothetical protein
MRRDVNRASALLGIERSGPIGYRYAIQCRNGHRNYKSECYSDNNDDDNDDNNNNNDSCAVNNCTNDCRSNDNASHVNHYFNNHVNQQHCSSDGGGVNKSGGAGSPNDDATRDASECRKASGICFNDHPEAVSGLNANKHYEGRPVLRICRHEPEGSS